jgi:hypothetical protein
LEEHLRRHLALCREVLAVVEREGQTWRTPDGPAAFPGCQAKKDLLPRLTQSLDELRRLRVSWQRLPPAERTQQKGVDVLMRQNQDMIMRILLLDRENEQALLRRGMLPARRLPSANRQRPHYVASLYQRNSNA